MPPLALSLFVEQVTKDPVFFVSVVATVVVSVTLHELGHAYAAIAQGDETPRLAGRLTLNPVAHMGVTSLVFLLVVGIAWGSTPVNPSRFRSRHGDALVSVAGPAVNLVLALLSLTALALLVPDPFGALDRSAGNFPFFLWVFGWINIVLMLFNLLPIPPLDGSSVVASFVPPYRRFIRDPNSQGAMFLVFIAIFFLAGELFLVAGQAGALWLRLLAG